MQIIVRRNAIFDLTRLRAFTPSWVRARVFKGAKSLRTLAALTYASCLLLGIFPLAAHAQQHIVSLDTSSSSLPDALLPQSGIGDETGQASSVENSATVAGVVLDSSGAGIPGARVNLTHRDGVPLRTLVSRERGEFAFTGLPAGSYVVNVSAKGFANFLSGEFTLVPQQLCEIPNISLSIASADTEVIVRPTEEIAAEQVKAEEKQRLIGVLPNFYISYARDPAPMTTKQKFSLASHDTLDWSSWVGISVAAGIEQANNSYAGYGQGAAGYGKRWAAQFADGRTSDYLSHAVYASLFHQDPRYFYQGTGTKKSRLYHALSSSFIARGDNGKNMPNYSYLLGAMTSGAISNAYYPHADRGASLVFTNSLLGIAGRSAGAVLQEFLSKKLSKGVPADAKP